jgi:hypothetical protein
MGTKLRIMPINMSKNSFSLLGWECEEKKRKEKVMAVVRIALQLGK